MAFTVTPSVESSSVPLVSTAPVNDSKAIEQYHTVLLSIYSVVLVSGTVSLSLMMYKLKSNMISSTSIAVLNLIFAHFIFLFTIPFRMHYYANSDWSLGHGWCRVISGMIHVHMYMSFIFYVIMLSTRLVTFYCRSGQEMSFNRVHTLLISIVVWIVVLVVCPCVLFFWYGTTEGREKKPHYKHCFEFGEYIQFTNSKVFNYIISIVIIVVSSALTALQANATWVLYRKQQKSRASQQDFGAHLKSLCFAAIMMFCFVPYHIFRLKYLENIDLQHVNEVFLSLTTLNCLDMLTFLGNRQCYTCLLVKKF